MEVKDLAMKVHEARLAQKEYFKNRTVHNLEISKKLERELDVIVSEIINPPVSNQNKLF